MRAGHIITTIAFFLLAWHTPRAVAAPGCMEGQPSKVIMLADGNWRPELEPVSRAIASQLQDLPVCFEVVWREDPPLDAAAVAGIAETTAAENGAAMAIWLLRGPQDGYQLHLLLPSRNGGKDISREVIVSGREGLAETLAIIVRASIGSAVVWEEDARSPEPTAPLAVPPPKRTNVAEAARDDRVVRPHHDESARLAFWASYFIGFPNRATDPVQGAALGLWIAVFRHVDLFASYLVLHPIEESVGGVGLRLRRHPTWIGGTLRFSAGRTELAAGVAVDIDYVVEDYSFSGSAPNRLEDPEPRVQISIIPMMGASFRIHQRLSLFAKICGEIVLNQYRYQILTEVGPKTVFNPWPIQPALLVGVEVRPF